MNGAEFEKALKMLRAYWPKSEKFRNQESTYAWYLALKPYAYDDVRQAIINVARTMRYPPDPADIIAQLPQPEQSTDDSVKSHAWMEPYIRDEEAYLAKLSIDRSITHYAAAHGITWGEAKKRLKGEQA